MVLPDGTALRERRVQLGEVSLHVVEAGPENGPAVILLHGFPEFWWSWRAQIGPLASGGFRVVVPDQRGYAGSDKPAGIDAYKLFRLGGDVVGLADALGIERFDLVGHDWGGIVAFWVAARHADRVKRLAILNAPHPDTFWRQMRRDPAQVLRSWYVAFFQLPRLPEALLSARHYRALAGVLVGSSRPGTFSRDDLRRYREAWAEPGAVSGMLSWYRALRRPAAPAGRVRVPTLILWGRKDRALGLDFADAALAQCDEGRLQWFPGATHWLQHEEPEAVNAALLDFLSPPPPSPA